MKIVENKKTFLEYRAIESERIETIQRIEEMMASNVEITIAII